MSSLITTGLPTTRALDRLRAGDIMTRDLATVGTTATISDAIGLMQTLAIRHLPVVNRGRCIGVLDERLVVFSLLRSTNLSIALEQQVGDVLGGDVATVPAGCPFQQVADELRRSRRDAVVVVDNDDHLLGIVTSADIVAAVALAQRGAGRRD